MPTERLLRFSIPAAALILSAGAAPAHRDAGPDQPIAHVVLCWLKEPGDAEQRRRVIEQTEAFRYMPGVLDLRTGPPLPSERPIVDDSFDVGVYLRLEGVQALERYLADPVHAKAVREVFAPLCGRIRVHDFYAP